MYESSDEDEVISPIQTLGFPVVPFLCNNESSSTINHKRHRGHEAMKLSSDDELDSPPLHRMKRPCLGSDDPGTSSMTDASCSSSNGSSQVEYPQSPDGSPLSDGITNESDTSGEAVNDQLMSAQDHTWLDDFSECEPETRLRRLSALVRECSHRELVHLQVALQPLLKRDFISQLPPEIGLQILRYLLPKDLLTCAQVSSRWREMSEDDLLWRLKCTEANIFHESGHSMISHPPAASSSTSSVPFSCENNSRLDERVSLVNWKRLFLRRRQLKCNWRRGSRCLPMVLKGHKNHVITCLEFYQDKVISSSDDSTIKVWSIETGECLVTLYGHIGGVWSSVMVDDLFVSGSTDRSVRVWDLDKGTCLHTLFGHISTVRCLASCGRRVVSGSRDTNLRVWDVDSGECLHLLQGHRGAVRCVQYVGNRIVSGSYDSTVRVWDADSEECLHILDEHMNRVYTLVFDGHHIVSGSLDTTIRVWEANNGRLVQTLYGHQSLTSGMELRKNILVSSNADATVRIWDINTGQCNHILAGENKHSSAVTCVQVTDDFVISASDDGTVKLWDRNTGAFIRNLIRLDSGGSGGVVWRILASETRLVCAAGSRNGAEETKLIVIDYGHPGESSAVTNETLLIDLTGESSANEESGSRIDLSSANGSREEHHVCQRRHPVGQTLSELLKQNDS